MQSRFNINNLLRNGEVSQFDLDRFQRLLQLLEIDADLANAVLDWMDADADSRFPGGAEDDVYMNRQPSHRAANRLFADKAELQLVEGVNAAIYQRLAPHVVALPDYTAINVNTATATSLAILADHLTRQDGEQLIRDRQDQPIENISEWLDQPLFEDGNLTPEGLGVASDYFQVLGEVQVAQRQLRHETLLYRGKGRGTRVVQRSRRGFFDG
jgi:general secretion pathway protein K